MKKLTLYFIGVIVVAGVISSALVWAQGTNSREEAEIRGALARQVEAWNAHDLDGFMSGYWRSPELTFYSGGNIAQGWDAAMARYQRNYQSVGKEMGTLEFSDLSVEVTSSDSSWVMGKYQLTISDGSKPHGIFTLIFRKIGGEWKIVHDHTSN